MGINQRFVNFSKPFIEATKNVFTTMTSCKMQPGSPVVKVDRKGQGNYSATISISGTVTKEDKTISDYKGILVLSFPKETYLKVASKILMVEYTDFSYDITDVGGEMVNIIMGNTKRELGQIGYTCNMSIPNMVIGDNHHLLYPEGTQVILIPMESELGPFFMEIAYKD